MPPATGMKQTRQIELRVTIGVMIIRSLIVEPYDNVRHYYVCQARHEQVSTVDGRGYN